MARSRYRSVTYDLEASLALARVVAAAGGDITPAAIASALGYSGTNNGAFLTRMASARLFGVVAGRSDRVLLSERAQVILSGSGPAASRARVEAFRAVPLFRAVLDSLAGGPLPEGRALAVLLVEEFGETETKATTVAAKLLDSAGQAGLLRPVLGQNSLLMALPTDITDHQKTPSNLFVPPVRYPQQLQHADGVRRQRWRARRRRAQRRRDLVVHDDRDVGRGHSDDEEQGLWLDDTGGRGDGWHPSQLRRAGVVAAAVACLAVVGVPVGLVLTSGGGATVALPPTHGHHRTGLDNGQAEHQVLSALSATTDSGSFNFSYTMSWTASTTSSSSDTSGSCPNASAAVSCAAVGYGGSGRSSSISGQGTINTSPMGMVATTNLGVTVRVDGTDYWEEGADDGGLAAPANDGSTSSGSPLSSFANLVEGTLGQKPGGVAMTGLASPTGYLDLAQGAVTGADQVGTGTVDGTAVTEYQASIDPTQLASDPGTTTEEATTIHNALQELDSQGLTGIEAKISIDASGYIRASTSVASFSDGDTVTLAATLSDFGCAGTVLMPGQQGSGTPPQGCVSPDTGVAPPSTTTTTVPPSTTTVPTSTTS